MSDIIGSLIGKAFMLVWVVGIILVANASAKKKNNKNRNAQNQLQQPGANPYTANRISGNAVPTGTAGGTRVYGNTTSAVPVVNRAVTGTVSPSAAGNSTVEYLAQKAREDEAEHLREEYMTKQKLTQGGALRLGLRIPDDGIIPRGMGVVCCGYCGAENVLPQGMSPKAFYCYFCHEQL